MTEHTTPETANRRKPGTESIPLESPDHIRLAHERSPLGHQSLNAEGHIEQVNQSWLEMLGYTREEVIGRSFADFITPSTRSQFPERFARFQRMGRIKATQWDMVCKDGRVVTVEFDGRAVYDAQGNFSHSHCIARDITDSNEAFRALQLSEQTYRTLIDSLPDIVMRFDRHGRHLFASENVADVTGLSADKFIGKTHRELGFPEEMCRLWEDAIRTVYDSGQARESEFAYEGTNGSVIFNWRLLPEFDADGRTASVLSVSRDVTAHRRAEQALQESENRYRLLFDEMLSGMALHEIITDESGKPVDYRFLSVNAAFERMTGLEASDIVGNTVTQVLPAMEPIWIERYGHVALTGVPTQFEEYSAPLGRHYEVRAYSPKPRQFAVVFNDVTERRAAVDELRASREKLATIFDSAPVMMLVLDERRRVRTANRAALEATGHTPESIRDLRGGEAVRCVHAIDGPDGCGLGPLCSDCTIRQIVSDTLTTGREHRGVTAVLPLAAAGGVQERCFSISTARADTSTDVLTLVCIEDITERTRAEDALRQSEARLRSLYESVQAGIVVQKADGRIVHCNPVAAEMFGMAREDIESRTSTDPVWQMVTEDGTPVAGKDHPSMITIRTGQPIRGAIRGIFSQSRARMRWLLINTEPQFNVSSGQLEEVIVTFLDITDLRRATESLRESEEKFRALFDQAPDSVVLIDADTGMIAEFNDRAHEALGYTRDEFRQMRVSDIEATESTEQAADHIALIKRSGQDVFETQHRAKDGHLLDVLVSVQTVSLRDQQFFLSIWTDITQRKQAERALRESEDKYRSLFSEMSSGCALHEIIRDEDGVPIDYITLEVNKTFETLLGAAKDEVVGKRVGQFLPPEELRRWVDVFGSVADTGTSRHYEMHSAANGKWFEGNAFSPQPGRFGVTFNDVTARKEAEKALEVHRAELQAIYDHAPIMMCVLDDSRHLCYANRAFETFSNTSESGVKGKSFCSVLGCTGTSDNPCARAVAPRCNHCQLRRAMEDTLETGASHRNVEFRGRVEKPDGVHEIVLLGATAIVQSGDKPDLLLCLQDVTEQRLAMDRAKQREAELAHVSRLTTLGEMASGLAHELNQPLSAILNYGAACSKLAGARSPDLNRIATNLDRIVAQANRATQIMSRIRAFAQRRPPRLGPVDLAQSAARVVELLSWDIRQKDVDVRLELNDPLAPVPADAVQIDQVLLNLAKNAIEAMQGVSRGQRQLTIRTSSAEDNAIQVEVADTGTGLPEEDAKRVFEAFFSTKPDGLGIGLSISRTIVEMHGGTLEAHNNPGPGCTFVMTLPLESPKE